MLQHASVYFSSVWFSVVQCGSVSCACRHLVVGSHAYALNRLLLPFRQRWCELDAALIAQALSTHRSQQLIPARTASSLGLQTVAPTILALFLDLAIDEFYSL